MFHKANFSYAEGVLGNSVMVAQMTLDHLVKVRILVPQWFDAADGFLTICLAHRVSNHPEQVSPKGERFQ
jgi:hypothetical protein